MLFIKIYLIIGIIFIIFSAIAVGGFFTLIRNMFKAVTEHERKKPDIFDSFIIVILLSVNLIGLWVFWVSLFLKNYKNFNNENKL